MENDLQTRFKQMIFEDQPTYASATDEASRHVEQKSEHDKTNKISVSKLMLVIFILISIVFLFNHDVLHEKINALKRTSNVIQHNLDSDQIRTDDDSDPLFQPFD